MPGELTRDAGLSEEEEISRDLKSVIDRLQKELSIPFLLDVKTLLAETKVDTLR